MAPWSPLTLTYFAERLIAFSIPDERRFFVVSHEGVHEVVLVPELSVNSDYSRPEGEGVFNGKKITYQGTTGPTLGLFGGTAIIVDKSCNVLDLKPLPKTSNEGVAEIWAPDGELVQPLPFKDFSEDWQVATFSTDFRHVVIGTPYEITVYRRSIR